MSVKPTEKLTALTPQALMQELDGLSGIITAPGVRQIIFAYGYDICPRDLIFRIVEEDGRNSFYIASDKILPLFQQIFAYGQANPNSAEDMRRVAQRALFTTYQFQLKNANLPSRRYLCLNFPFNLTKYRLDYKTSTLTCEFTLADYDQNNSRVWSEVLKEQNDPDDQGLSQDALAVKKAYRELTRNLPKEAITVEQLKNRQVVLLNPEEVALYQDACFSGLPTDFTILGPIKTSTVKPQPLDGVEEPTATPEEPAPEPEAEVEEEEELGYLGSCISYLAECLRGFCAFICSCFCRSSD
jgi:hypothetical protein